MYKLPHFTEGDREKIIAFMKDHSFAVIAGTGEKYPVATHIPLEIEEHENGRLIFTGHLMKNTDHHKAFQKNEQVLVIFNGPQTFVSASWYPQPLSGSTWNYMTVHARGKINFTDEAGTYHAVKAITEKYEGGRSPASFDQLPDVYINTMLKAIVGFTIEVISLDHTFKLSQNHDNATRHNIAVQLRKRGDDNAVSIAKEIEERLDQ